MKNEKPPDEPIQLSRGRRINREKRRRPKKNKVRRSIPGSRSILNNRRDNEAKFRQFAEDKPYRVIEKKIQRVIPLDMTPHLFYLCMLNNIDFNKLPESLFRIRYLELSPIILREYQFESGVYQEFYIHFQKSLINKADMSLVQEFAEWIAGYLGAEQVTDQISKTLHLEKAFLQSHGLLKTTKKTSEKTLRYVRLHSEGMSYKQIAIMMLMEDDDEFPKSEPKSSELRKHYRSTVKDRRDSIANIVNKYRKNKRDSRGWEDLFSHMGNLFGYLRIGDKSYLIPPCDE